MFVGFICLCLQCMGNVAFAQMKNGVAGGEHAMFVKIRLVSMGWYELTSPLQKGTKRPSFLACRTRRHKISTVAHSFCFDFRRLKRRCKEAPCATVFICAIAADRKDHRKGADNKHKTIRNRYYLFFNYGTARALSTGNS